MIRESRILYGVQKRDWILLINFRRFCNRVIGSPRNTAKGTAEWGLGREGRKGRVLCSVVKYWYRALLMEKDELLKCSYEWQAENLKCNGCTRNLSDKLYKFGLEYLWLDMGRI